MNATINVVCCKWKTLANGEVPLMLRICKDGKKKYLFLLSIGTLLEIGLNLVAQIENTFRR